MNATDVGEPYDQHLKTLHCWLEEGRKPCTRKTLKGYQLNYWLQFESFIQMVDGKVNNHECGSRLEYVVPEYERQRVLEALHQDPGGHFGVGKTFPKLKQRYYWPNYRRDVLDFVKTCECCRRTEKNQTYL